MRNLQRVLQATQDRLDRLENQEATLQAELAVIEYERAQIQGAFYRIRRLSLGEQTLGPFDCLDCFVLNNVVTKLEPVPTDDDEVRFRCTNCGSEFVAKQ